MPATTNASTPIPIPMPTFEPVVSPELSVVLLRLVCVAVFVGGGVKFVVETMSVELNEAGLDCMAEEEDIVEDVLVSVIPLSTKKAGLESSPAP
jgi:hypothetical protein